jgi:hypothetical protein
VQALGRRLAAGRSLAKEALEEADGAVVAREIDD